MKAIAIAFSALLLSNSQVLSDTVRPLGKYRSWSAWTYTEKNLPKCYIYSEPLSRTPASLDHGRVGFSIRALRSKTRSEASFQAGYEFAPQTIIAVIDRNRFEMVPRGKSAWLRREGREAEFLAAIRKGKMMTVEAVSRRGNKTSYRFVLEGVSAAMRKARRTCQ